MIEIVLFNKYLEKSKRRDGPKKKIIFKFIDYQ